METTDPKSAGFDPERLARLGQAIQADVDAERYDGCEVVVGRRGRVVLHQQFGFADRAARRPVARDQVFASMSIGKQLTVAVVLSRIERGDFALTTHVADLIPGFAQKGKAHVTIAQLLTHTSGIVSIPPVAPDQLTNLEAAIAAICASPLESRPGSRVVYSILAGHAVLAECVRRVEGCKRPFRQIVQEDLLQPLGMRDTALGARPDLKKRMAPIVVRDRSPGLLDPDFLEALNALLGPESELPAGGYLTTARDMHRFAEMLRGGGALGGARILSPATVRAVQVNRTGDASNSIWDYALAVRGWQPWPAYLGLGFFLRGEGVFPTPFGQLASPRAFGGFGAGSTAFWVDPERELTYAFLSSGLLEESKSLERHQRLADLVHAAVVD
jgi:CubicO group peptidase (beta-lactamase class C family)